MDTKLKFRLSTSCRLLLTKKAKIRAYLARFVVASEERFRSGIKKLSSIPECLKKSYLSLCPTFVALLITVSERHCFTNFYVRGIAKNGILLANVANFYVRGLAKKRKFSNSIFHPGTETHVERKRAIFSFLRPWSLGWNIEFGNLFLKFVARGAQIPSKKRARAI